MNYELYTKHIKHYSVISDLFKKCAANMWITIFRIYWAFIEATTCFTYLMVFNRLKKRRLAKMVPSLVPVQLFNK